jgi:hypothetical protein
MSSKSDKTIKLPIKGSEWSFVFQTEANYDKTYFKIHQVEEDTGDAHTVAMLKTVYISKPSFDSRICYHELLHVLVAESNSESANLTPSQMEELCCSLIASHYEELAVWTRKLLDFYHNEVL